MVQLEDAVLATPVVVRVSLPERFGSAECGPDDVLDASDGDAHCRWCGSIIPATNYLCAVSQRCCSVVCQALYCRIEVPFKPDGEIDSPRLRQLVKQMGVTIKEKLLPDYIVEREAKRAESEARNHFVWLRARAKELGIGWPRDWRKVGWKSEKKFLADMQARISSRTVPVAEKGLPEAA